MSRAYSYIPSFLDFLPIQVTTQHWAEFPAIYSMFLLVIYFVHTVHSHQLSISYIRCILMNCLFYTQYQLCRYVDPNLLLDSSSLDTSSWLPVKVEEAFALSHFSFFIQAVTIRGEGSQAFQVLSVCWLKKQSQPQSWELCFYSVGVFRTSSPGDSISSSPERTALRSGVG